MTTLNQAKEQVLLQFKTAWDALHPTIPYFFENQKAPQPTVDTWVRVTVVPGDDRQETMGPPGARNWRRPANIWVQLFGPLDVGTQLLDGLVQDVRTIFEGASYGGVDSTDSSRVNVVGTDGRWYEVVVVSPIAYYEVR